MSQSVARVFPRRTSATPDDDLAFVGGPPLFRVEAEEVHVSCTFTWDRDEARRLTRQWQAQGYNVKLGGPAMGSPAGEFAPGRYVKRGMTFTSRGCIRRCPRCFVPEREGALRLLPIVPGWDILDNNLLACPRAHIEAVLDMLEEQPRAARFTGGIDARLCKPWFVKRLATMRLDILYTAYDDPTAQGSAVERTVGLLREAGLKRWAVGCYVLVGYDGDTQTSAETRLEWVKDIGATPFAMYYRPPDDKRGQIPSDWSGLVRSWSRPAAIFACEGDPPMTLTDTLLDQQRALAAVRLEEMNRPEAAARLVRLRRGTSGHEAEHAPPEREERPGAASGYEAEQEPERERSAES